MQHLKEDKKYLEIITNLDTIENPTIQNAFDLHVAATPTYTVVDVPNILFGCLSGATSLGRALGVLQYSEFKEDMKVSISETILATEPILDIFRLKQIYQDLVGDLSEVDNTIKEPDEEDKNMVFENYRSLQVITNSVMHISTVVSSLYMNHIGDVKNPKHDAKLLLGKINEFIPLAVNHLRNLIGCGHNDFIKAIGSTETINSLTVPTGNLEDNIKTLLPHTNVLGVIVSNWDKGIVAIYNGVLEHLNSAVDTVMATKDELLKYYIDMDTQLAKLLAEDPKEPEAIQARLKAIQDINDAFERMQFQYPIFMKEFEDYGDWSSDYVAEKLKIKKD